VATTWVVNTLADDGAGSLRDAINNAQNGDTIDATGVSGVIQQTNGTYTITNSITILGPGAYSLVINGGISFVGPLPTRSLLGHRVFFLSTGGSTNPPNITLAGIAIKSDILSDLSNGGGAILNNGATVTVSNCLLFHCTAGTGGAIQNGGTMTIVNSTLWQNQANSAGAIYNLGTLRILNSTFNINSANDNVSILGGTVTILNSTFSANGRFLNGGINANTTIGSTILDGTTLTGTVTSLGYNLSTDNGGGFLTNATDITNTSPNLGPLQDHGGPTPTQAPLCGSPAIDQGTNFTGLATDQRGAPRTFDDPNIPNAPGGDGTDIGAVEAPIRFLTVTNTSDSGPGSLRQAIADANSDSSMATIQFAASAYGTITLTSGELLITECLFINGPGATNVAVNGNAASRVFHVGSGINVTISGLTIANGAADKGGGINNDHSRLTVRNCVVTGNSGSDSGAGIYNDGEFSGSATLTVSASTVSSNSSVGANGGGGIRNTGQHGGSATLSVIASTLAGNTSPLDAGGIANSGNGGNAVLTIVNSTLSGNSAARNGGGIHNDAFSSGTAALTLLNSTFSGNSAGGNGGGIHNESIATLSIGSTILNVGGGYGVNLYNNPGGSVTSLGYNLSSDGGGGFLSQPTDLVNTDPTLGPLQDNGGPTPTCALLCGSPAIDKGTNFFGLATDQRGIGFPRTFDEPFIANAGDGTDIGAFEVQVAITPPSLSCPNNMVVTNDPGQCSAVVNYTVTASDNCSVPTVTEDFPSGMSFPKGTTTVHVTAVNAAGLTNTCAFTITVLDKEPPLVMCQPAPNPSGKIPPPGKGGSTGQNPGGYYQLLAKDNCDPNPLIYVKDQGSTFVAGPFHNGDIVRVKHTGGTPSSAPGTAPVVAIISLNGNGLTVAQDASGNVTPDASGCLLISTLP
jgi:hypothetical protein